MLRAAIAAIALMVPAASAAHSFWIEPAQHDPQVDEEVRVTFRVGDAGEARDWGLYWERIVALRLYGPNGTIDQQHAVRTTQRGERGTVRLSVPEPGSYVLGFESNVSFSDLEAQRFDDYVDGQALTAIAAHREATGTTGVNGTELYARRAKALIQVDGVETENITTPIGHTLEIVPLESPFALNAGDPLPIQVLWRGAPLEGVRIEVVRPFADYETTILTTDADGKASFELKHGSRYLVSAVWGVPAPHDSRADYFTIFSSLTFPSPSPVFDTDVRPPSVTQ
ncbi:MAG: DUF4198 domain-containing protein [Erythrobacter sp.]